MTDEEKNRLDSMAGLAAVVASSQAMLRERAERCMTVAEDSASTIPPEHRAALAAVARIHTAAADLLDDILAGVREEEPPPPPPRRIDVN